MQKIKKESAMKRIDYMAAAQEAMTRIKKGAFLTVKSGEAINTMTIGWATIGYVWRKPIMMIAVRLSRHTFSIIETAEDFTVSMPSSDMKKEIMFCGTKSGRDCNKFKECNLQVSDSRKVVTPIIKVPGIHYECKIVYKSAMDPAYLTVDYDTELYPQKDYHTLYFGEIVDSYEID
ncbi:MAG: flavin reductase family protein [Desulfobacterales bacterium]|nr:MAG: flavin reductase family protein [Desulfobacterales bacterium]